VSRFPPGRHAALALGAALAFALASQAWSARPSQQEPDLPRQDPAHCKGQPEIKPLQPLTVTTGKGEFRFMVEVAGTGKSRAYGLMCRKSLAADRGMLFVFPSIQTGSAFWMRNTLIPLDIIYIRPDGTVLSIAPNAQPLNEQPIPAYGSVRTVLELAAGRAAQMGLLPGDRIQSPAMPHG
jgi:uncharacterized membrane protein (UPF0127 family)